MQYLTLRNTNINVSRVSFGTASLHHLLSPKKRNMLLEKALSLGITHFDTSPYYGYGLSEVELGKMLKGQRNDITISTKVGLYPPKNTSYNLFNIWTRKAIGKFYSKLSKPEIDWSVKVANLSLEQSLKRLNTDYVDFLFLHEPNMIIIETEEFTKWIEELIKQGKIRHGGLAGLPKFIQPWIEKSHPLCKVIQTRDSPADREIINSFSINGHMPQFTYGVLSQISQSDPLNNVEKIMQNALQRNYSGSVIVSTRKLLRLKELIGPFK